MGAVAYKVSSPYEQLIAAIDDAASNANSGSVRQPQSIISCFDRGPDGVHFNCLLILENWKWRPGKTTEAVTLVGKARERLSLDAATLLESVVQVSYFEMNSGKPAVLHSVHYDFGPPLDCHPTFHAQFTANPVIPTIEETAEIKCELQFEHAAGRCFKNARIPTSDMTFASVLLCLAADHLGGQFFLDFRAKVLEIQKAMPQPDYEALRSSLADESTHLSNSHWFAHMT
jgi:hypothetical protein